jgi:hypothetical protein
MPKKDHPLYVAFDTDVQMRWIYGLMAESGRSMKDVVTRCIDFCREAKSFKVPAAETTADKLQAAQEKRTKRLLKKAGRL